MNNSTKDLILDGITINSGGSETTGIYNNVEANIIINDCNISITADYRSTAIYNKENGNITVNNGNIYGYSYAIENQSLGDILINNGNISGGSSFGAAIINRSFANVTVKSGIITAINGRCTAAIYNNSKGTITIDGGNIVGGSWEGYGILNKSTGTVIINGGTITDRAHGGIYNESTGNVIARNVNFEGNVAIQNRANAVIELYDCDIKSEVGYNNVIVNNSGGTIKLQGCNITQTNRYTYDVIVNNNVGKIIIDDCNIETLKRSVYNNSTGTIEIKSGNITSTSSSAVFNNSTGIILIGENDDTVSIEQPYLYGETYAIDNLNGDVNFYDGILKGKADAINGGITEFPENYELYITYENSIYTGILMLPNEHEPVAQVDEELYYTLQDAIDACGIQENAKQIKVLRDIRQTRVATILEGQNIELDMQGYSIIGYLKDATIINQGILSIVDNSEANTGNITVRGKKIISNLENATLNINALKLNISGSGGTSSSKKYYIYNEGIATIENITISNQNSAYTYGIYTTSTSNTTINQISINISGGSAYGIYNDSGIINGNNVNITSYDYAIYNNAGSINVTEGTIKSTHSSYYAYTIINDDGEMNLDSINATGVINRTEGIVEIKNSELIAGGHLIRNEGTGNVKVEQTTIKKTSWTNGGDAAVYNFSTGEVELIGCNITSQNYGIRNEKTGNVKLNNTKIDSSDEGIRNVSGNIEIEGGTIKSSKQGILVNSGTAWIKSGSIQGTNAVNVGTGTLILGEKDGIVSIEEPSLTGTTNGVYNMNGIFKFYDGIIKGNIAINEYVSEREEFYDVQRTTENNIQTAILVRTTPEAMIIETGEEYQLLKDAILASQPGQTIKILKDLEWADEENRIEILENQNIKIDLNGHLLIAQFDEFIRNYGTLEMFDESKETSISANNYIVKNYEGATLKLNGTKLNLANGGTSSSKKYYIYNEGIATIENITISNQNSVYTYVIYTTSTSNTTINEISINISGDSSYGIYNDSGIINGNNVNITSYDYAIYNNAGSINVTEGTIKSTHSFYYAYTIINDDGEMNLDSINATGVINRTEGTVEIKNSELIAGGHLIRNEGTGNVKVEQTTIKKTSWTNGGDAAVYNFSTGEVELIGCNITSPNYGIRNEGTGNVKLNNTKIDSSDEGIRNVSGNIEIEGGTIKSSKEGILVNSGTAWIKTGSIQGTNAVNVGTGTLILGEKDGIVSIEEPILTGTTYGVYNMNGIFNFYDGIIKGTTAIKQYIHDKETGYDVQTSVDESGVQTAILGIATPEAQIVETGIIYETLQEALLECTTEELKTIKILKDLQLYNDERRVEIAEGTNVKIDLDGYRILGSVENCIVNNGTLELINENVEKTSNIEGNKNKVFANNSTGTLKISNVNIAITTGGTYNSYNTLIYNQGILETNNININENVGCVYVYYNVDEGSIIANGCNITSPGNTEGIYNTGSGKIELTDVSMNLARGSSGVKNLGTSNIILNNYNVSLYPYDTSYGVYNTKGKVEINGGTYNEVREAIYNENEVIINDINVTNCVSINNSGTGTLIIEGGNINTRIENRSSNTKSVIINGGTMTYSNDYAILNYGNGGIEVNDGYVGGISAGSGNVLIKGGTIQSPKNGVNITTGSVVVTGGNISGSNAYGIYNQSGTLTIGEDDSDVNEMQLEVLGVTYGVYNTGTFNFYDGKIKGQTSIYSNTVNIPEDYEINKKVTDEIETAKLSVKSTLQTVAEINGVYYTTLAAAVRACENDVETTIKLTMAVELFSTINISPRQNIIIDLNGTNIFGAIEENMIENEGTLRIIDMIGTGKIENTIGGEIGGTGTLILGDENGQYIPTIIN